MTSPPARPSPRAPPRLLSCRCRRVGRWRSYLFGETAYVVLSLVAKWLLAWQVFAGALAS